MEFGSDVCKDPTHTLADLTGVWCSGRTRNVTRSIAGGGQRVSTQPGGMKYVVVWEKR